MTNRALYVSDIVNQIKQTLDQTPALQNVSIIGELSNVSVSANNHWYFTLKDEKARLSCVMFANRARLLKTPFKEGDEVLVLGRISLYEASGSVQCYVADMQLYGVGNLYVQLELTRKKLAALGYFDPGKKKPLPLYPRKIGLVTSHQTAAYHDVVSTLKRRWPIAEVYFHHSQVQGMEAVKQLVDALKTLDEQNLDVILMVRGGGSIEDLWCFNDEALVLAIYDMQTPVVSGVGHESDITLVDYVVDQRGPTPTGAAELITPHQDDVRYMVLKLQNNLAQATQHYITNQKAQLKQYQNHYFFKNPMNYVLSEQNKLQILKNRMVHYVESMTHQRDKILQLKQRLHHSVNQTMQAKQTQIKNQQSLLKALSHETALKRGFSISYVDDKIVHRIDQVKIKSKLKTKLSDGYVYSIIERVKEND